MSSNYEGPQEEISRIASVSSGSANVEIIKNISTLNGIHEFWLACSPSRDADPELFRFLVEARPQEDTPYIMVLRAAAGLEALLVGRRVRLRLPVKIGYFQIPSPELTTLVISNGGWLGNIDEISASLLIGAIQQLLSSGEADAAFLHYPELTSPLARQALTLPKFICRDHLIIPEQHRILNLPMEEKSFLASLSQNERYQQRKRERRLVNDFNNVRINNFSLQEDIALLMQQVELVAQKSYQRSLGVGFVMNDFTKARLEFLARIGWLRSFLLCIDERPVAFWIGTLRRGVFTSDYLAFDPAFKKYAPGMYLILRAIEMLQKDKSGAAHQIDFGLGDGDYKERLSNQTLKEAPIYIFAPNVRGLTANLLRSSFGYINYIVKTRFREDAWLGNVKRMWRAVLTGAGK